MSVKLAVIAQVQSVNALTTYIGVTTVNNYVTGVGGDACSLAASNISDPNGKCPSLPGNASAVIAGVDSEALAGNYCELIPAATLAGYKLKWYAPGGAELGSGAYPVGTLTLKMVAPKGL